MPKNETERLKAIEKYLSLKKTRVSELSDVVWRAATTCKTFTAYISLISNDRHKILFDHYADFKDLPREHIHSNFSLLHEDLLVVPDTLLDERFTNNPYLLPPNSIRFYAGANLITPEGYQIGTLCVIGKVPKKLSGMQKWMLSFFAQQVVKILDNDLMMQEMLALREEKEK